jgi:hypothetical protein
VGGVKYAVADRVGSARVVEVAMCASSVEGAMKSILNLPPEDRIPAKRLFAKALGQYPALSSFAERDLKEFRETRNHILHYGFSPRDDEKTAALLLKTGFPFLNACYSEFFNFDVLDGLAEEFRGQLRIALDVYQKAKDMPDLDFSYCFSAFGHLIRWAVKPSFMSYSESVASEHAQELKFEHCQKMKTELERVLGLTWLFDCPICDDSDTLVCELDEDQLDDKLVALKRGVCASCGLVVRTGAPFLMDALCQDQIPRKREEILRDLGIRDP